MTHAPRLHAALRTLLQGTRAAALGTLGEDGAPQVSMVPFAVNAADGCLVIHVSGLAAHTRYLARSPAASLLVMQPERAEAPVHDLPRVSLSGRAETLAPETALHERCRAAYLARFPEAEPMTQLGDFRFVAIRVQGARQIAGFGAARSVDAEELAAILRGV